MIENQEQLAAVLDYITTWADALEGMRRHELDTASGLFPILAAGPLNEIRANLELARDYTRRAATQDHANEEAAVERGIADYETGRTITLGELQSRMQEHKEAVNLSPEDEATMRAGIARSF